MKKYTGNPDSNLTKLHNGLEVVVSLVQAQIKTGYISPLPYSQILSVVTSLFENENEAHKGLGSLTEDSRILYMDDYAHLRSVNMEENHGNQE